MVIPPSPRSYLAMSSRFVAVLPPTAGAQLRESHTSLAPQLIIVTTCDPAPADTAARMCVVKVTPPEETKQTEDEVMAAAYGLKFVKRNRLEHGLRRFAGIPFLPAAWMHLQQRHGRVSIRR